LGARITYTITSRHDGQNADTEGATPRHDATAFTAVWPWPWYTRVRSARTHALNHKKKITTARRLEFLNARVGAMLASRSGGALRGVPRFGEQKCGQAPTCRECPGLRLG
jgi:hypothetical protein